MPTEWTVWLCLCGIVTFDHLTHQHSPATNPPGLLLYLLKKPTISDIYWMASPIVLPSIGFPVSEDTELSS